MEQVSKTQVQLPDEFVTNNNVGVNEPVLNNSQNLSAPVTAKEPKTNFAYFNNLYILNEMIHHIVCFNFGFKQNESCFKVFTKLANMTEKDKANFIWICEKYRIDIMYTPYIIFDNFKNVLLSNFEILKNSVIYANSLYCQNEYEINKKRAYINEAIGTCEIIIQNVQMISQILELDHEKILVFTKTLLDEVEQLKRWKRSTTKVYEAIQKEEEKKRIILNFQKGLSCPFYIRNNDNTYELPGNYYNDKNVSLIEMRIIRGKALSNMNKNINNINNFY